MEYSLRAALNSNVYGILSHSIFTTSIRGMNYYYLLLEMRKLGIKVVTCLVQGHTIIVHLELESRLVRFQSLCS